MRTIIVPTDFSGCSVNAALYAVDMATAVNANIILLNVAPVSIEFSEIPVPPGTFDIMLEDAKTEMENIRGRLLLYANQPINIDTTIVFGSVMEQINALALQTNPIAIIMGITGAGATARKLFGSNALSAMHTLRFPVMIVPQSARYKNVSKLALACDINDINDTIPIDSIEHTLALFNCKLDVVYVSTTREKNYATIMNNSMGMANILSKFHPEMHFISNTNVAMGIASFITAKKIDLLLVLPKPHGIFGWLFHKSISNTIASKLLIPVIALHGC